MMDENVWDYFAGGVTNAHAYGGPTLEMFEKSYNAVHETKLAEHSSITSTNSNSTGYKIAWAATEANTEPNWVDTLSGLPTLTDNMWVKISRSKASGLLHLRLATL